MTPSSRLRQRFTLLGVFAVFMLPILIALALNLPGVAWRPFGVRNHGELLQPPPSLSELQLRAVDDGGSFGERPLTGGWTVLLTAEAPCDTDCESALERLHRAQLSLGEHGGRVRLLWIALGDTVPAADALAAIRARYPSLRIGRPVADSLPDPLADGGAGATPHVVDPRGYLILRYPPPFEGRDLLKDLQRLLRYSKAP